MLKKKNIANFLKKKIWWPASALINILKYSRHEFKILISLYESNFFIKKNKGNK